MINQEQLGGVFQNQQTLANNLALEGRVLDASIAHGSILVMRALCTEIETLKAKVAELEAHECDHTACDEAPPTESGDDCRDQPVQAPGANP